MTRAHGRVLALTLAACVATAHAARADGTAAPTDVQRAAELKKEGDALMVELEYRHALDVYQQAYALSADPALLYNRARAHQALAEYPEALDLLEQFDRAAPADLKARVPKLEALVADVRARVATIEVRCDAEGSRVLVRDRDEGPCDPSKPIRTRAGPGKIEVRADGYTPFVREMDLPGGARTTVEAHQLKALDAGQSFLTIETSPAGALLVVDNHPLGPSPASLALEAGRHVIFARQDGYDEARMELETESGQRRRVDVSLHKTGPITTKWWFWTGVGAAVVGGTVLTYALLSTREPPTGSIPPGQVRGP